MNAKYRGLLSALAAVGALLAAPGAHAIVINAADYPIGTNLTDAFPGAILQYAYYNGYGPGFITSPLVVGTDTDFVHDGGAQFNTLGGATYDGGEPPQFGVPSGDGPWGAIYIAFTVPVYSVSAVGYNEDADPAIIIAYGQQTVVAGDDTGGPLQTPCIRSRYFACLEGHEETVSSTTPISYILVGGLSEETLYTELDIPGIAAVSEPSSLALFGCCLLAIGFITLRRRRLS